MQLRAPTSFRGPQNKNPASVGASNSERLVSMQIQVGTISANGEREIGELIAKAMERVGKEGVITVEASLTNFLSLWKDDF